MSFEIIILRMLLHRRADRQVVNPSLDHHGAGVQKACVTPFWLDVVFEQGAFCALRGPCCFGSSSFLYRAINCPQVYPTFCSLVPSLMEPIWFSRAVHTEASVGYSSDTKVMDFSLRFPSGSVWRKRYFHANPPLDRGTFSI